MSGQLVNWPEELAELVAVALFSDEPPLKGWWKPGPKKKRWNTRFVGGFV